MNTYTYTHIQQLHSKGTSECEYLYSYTLLKNKFSLQTITLEFLRETSRDTNRFGDYSIPFTFSSCSTDTAPPAYRHYADFPSESRRARGLSQETR